MSAVRPISDRNKGILAARARGFSMAMIGQALNISTSRVQQVLDIYGAPEPAQKKKRPHAQRFAICGVCGKQRWIAPNSNGGFRFCSKRCVGISQRRIDERVIKRVIDMRVLGAMTWTTIAKQQKCTQQTLQMRIWKYLAEQGALTARVVGDIWQGTPSEHPRKAPGWQWLVKKTGIAVK